MASKESVKKMQELMYNVVYNGFEYNKVYSPDNVKIAGKTGTAQIASPTGGYLTGKNDYIKSFLGFFPYENPKYIFYFATKQFEGSGTDIALTIANALKDVANIVNVTESKNDMDESKIVTISQMISKDVATVAEDLRKKGLNPIVIGNGKYVINQYPEKETTVIAGSKVFLLTSKKEVKMPDVLGWSTNEIIRFCDMVHLKYFLNGYGKVKSTNIPKDQVIDIHTMSLEINLE